MLGCHAYISDAERLLQMSDRHLFNKGYTVLEGMAYVAVPLKKLKGPIKLTPIMARIDPTPIP